MAKKVEELEKEIARLEQENERLDIENVRLMGRNLLMSEQLNSWYELKQRVNWLKAEMQRGQRLMAKADMVDDAELLAMLENRLEQEPGLVTAEFGMKELAELIGVSQARLIRLFRNSTIFRSPDEYLENIRLMRALQLLRDHPEYGIAAISAEAGYNSVRTLQRRMSEVIGMTPVEFRMMTEKV
jgi:transcriptional regulator GlxA family with amidase domain